MKARQFLSFGSCLFLISCQQLPKSKMANFESVRFQDFSEQLDTQSRVVEEMRLQVKSLKEKVKKLEIAQVAKVEPKLPIVKIQPPKEEDIEGVGGGEGEEDTLVASSQNESNHWFLEGEDYFKAQKFELAINAYHHFLKEAPEDNPRVEEANLRLIESYLRNKEYGLTLLNSNRMEAKYPNSRHLPKVLSLKAECFAAMGNSASQQKTMKELMKKFPQSYEAKKVSQRFAEYKPKSKKDDNKPKLLDKTYRF